MPATQKTDKKDSKRVKAIIERDSIEWNCQTNQQVTISWQNNATADRYQDEEIQLQNRFTGLRNGSIIERDRNLLSQRTVAIRNYETIDRGIKVWSQ